MKSIPEIISELRAMPVAGLVDEYTRVFGKPPRIKHRDWLWRRIAWKVQEQRYGGLSEVAKRRLDGLIGELDVPLGRAVPPPVARRDPPPGTTLVRVWKGQEIRATAVDGGWEWNGVPYRSLTAVAKAVTGSHWNGRAFFGLKREAAG